MKSIRSRHLVRVLAVIGIAATLGGCIVAPYPGYYRPHYYRPYYYY